MSVECIFTTLPHTEKSPPHSPAYVCTPCHPLSCLLNWPCQPGSLPLPVSYSPVPYSAVCTCSLQCPQQWEYDIVTLSVFKNFTLLHLCSLYALISRRKIVKQTFKSYKQKQWFSNRGQKINVKFFSIKNQSGSIINKLRKKYFLYLLCLFYSAGIQKIFFYPLIIKWRKMVHL